MSRQRSTPRWLRELCGRRPWTVEDARRVLDEQQASGQSVGEFAARVGLNAQRLYWWRDRVSAEALDRGDRTAGLAMAELIPVVARTSGAAAASAELSIVEVIAGEGTEVRVRVNDLSPAAATWVAAMLRSLREARS